MLARRLGIPIAAELAGAPWERQHFFVRAIYLRGEFLLDRELRAAIEDEQGEGSSLEYAPPLPVLTELPQLLELEAAGEPIDTEAVWRARDPKNGPPGIAPSKWRLFCKGIIDRAQLEDAAAGDTGTLGEKTAGVRGVNMEQADRMGFTVREV